MPHVLIVDDDATSTRLLAELISAEGFTTSTATTLTSARAAIARRRPDAVLLDLQLPDGNGMELFEDAALRSTTEIVLTTGHGSLESSIQAFRQGATDYLTKPIDIARLRAILSRIARPPELKEEIEALRGQLRGLGRFGKLIGVSPAMQRLYDQIAKVAPTTVSVLISGASGTGKELVAESIHLLSRRKRMPFLAVNCGAMSAELIESEMFGHERGSFTGADRKRIGIFERANGGTLFLDEITEMPFELQVKLLRVLETGILARVGGQEDIAVDVRILAATNRPPSAAVEQGRLREDLLYRLQVFPIELPALRDRPGDVELIAQHMLEEIGAAEGSHKRFAPDALALLRSYVWPGNVRELRNVVSRAYIMADGAVVDGDALPPELAGGPAPTDSGAGADPAQSPFVRLRLGTRLADAQRELILATLQACGGSRAQTARMLGISAKTLYNRLRAYGENPVDPKPSDA